MFRQCLILVISRWSLGRVSVVFWRCLGFVVVMSRCYFGNIQVQSRSCLGAWSRFCFFGDVSVLFGCCFVGFLVMFWEFSSDVLVTFRVCFGKKFCDIWWWCCDMLIMSGRWFGVSFLLRWWYFSLPGIFIYFFYFCIFGCTGNCKPVLCSYGVIHTNIENKYIGSVNKMKYGGSKFQILFSPIFSFILYLALSQTTRGGPEQTKRRNRALA